MRSMPPAALRRHLARWLAALRHVHGRTTPCDAGLRSALSAPRWYGIVPFVARLPMGTAIFRRYVLIGAIGQGGVSTVYSAVDARHGRKLAVKVLAPTLADDASARDDVRREALITDRLRHPSVPRVFE